MKQEDKRIYWSNFAFLFAMEIILIIVALGMLFLIFYYWPKETREQGPIAILLTLDSIFLIGLLYLVFERNEFYVKDSNKICVRSIIRTKKEVQLKLLQNVCIQKITCVKYFSLKLKKGWYYVLNDRSSKTVRSCLCSLKKDLMKIPANKKSEKFIRSFWDKEIRQSNYSERC